MQKFKIKLQKFWFESWKIKVLKTGKEKKKKESSFYTLQTPVRTLTEIFLYKVKTWISTGLQTPCSFCSQLFIQTLPSKLQHWLTSSRLDNPGSIFSSEITSSIAFCTAMKSWSSAVSNCNLKQKEPFQQQINSDITSQTNRPFPGFLCTGAVASNFSSYWRQGNIFKTAKVTLNKIFLIKKKCIEQFPLICILHEAHLK